MGNSREKKKENNKFWQRYEEMRTHAVLEETQNGVTTVENAIAISKKKKK